jgi:hypothetical protein
MGILILGIFLSVFFNPGPTPYPGIIRLIAALVILPLGLIPLLFMGRVVANEEFIEHRLPIGLFRLQWSEIDGYESDGTSILLTSMKKVLPLTSSFVWTGKDKKKLSTLIKRKIEEHNIPYRKSVRPMYYFWPSGTRH